MVITPSPGEFRRRARSADLVPVSCEIPADLETPVSAYLKVVGAGPGFLLESVAGGETLGRYSFLGADPGAIIRVSGDRIDILEAGRKKTFRAEPLPFLRRYLSGFRVFPDPELPRFSGGLVGYFGYDTVRFLENLPSRHAPDPDQPDSQLFFADTVIAFDHVRQRLKIITHARSGNAPEQAFRCAAKRLESIVRRLETGVAGRNGDAFDFEARRPVVRSDFSRAEFIAAVRRAKDYIRKGDAIQVVLSRSLAPARRVERERVFNLYRVLRSVNPSPYLFYLNFGSESLIGSSPEVMVRLEGETACVRPIAGTRPRGGSDVEDAALAAEMAADPKEKAEHIMLVDLGRNDLGRVCSPGSVEVTELMVVERYSHVMHLVSNVRGVLRADRDAFDLFSACFPAGTVTGAPKVRAMEIIDELETGRRGPYAGAVGYFDFAGNLDTAITIRTIFVRGDRASIRVGAGIVADSVPEKEYEETANKGKALLEAFRMATGRPR